MMKADDIREEFLSFFEKKHSSTRIKSSSLIPDNPTILLTTAGMVQFVPYYLNIEKPPFSPARATTCQKCARAGGKDSDIENVGRTPRHHTFFEMLGNFAFNDYYKEEVIPWAWDFVTNYLKLDKNRLWITIYENDDEAGELWQKAGVPKERILKKGKKDNFWGPPGASGPCGPCSEIHYDLGEHLKCSPNCGIDTCECDRWIEIWNLVFTEIFQDEEGNQRPLGRKNVDTGMGLERIAMVCQGVNSTFETDLLRPILDKVCEISGKKYLENEKTDISLRIVTDHARCVSFMIADGISASNEGRGYVLRMILRRALRHGYLLGLDLPFLRPVVETVINRYKAVYPELEENKEKIISQIEAEEKRFKLTLQKGQVHIEDVIKAIKSKGQDTIIGEEAFKLYDTYGFPFELTKDIAEENNLKVDLEGFNKCMEEQKTRARQSVQKTSVANDMVYAKYQDTEFIGYEENECEAKVIGIIKDLEDIDENTSENDIVDIMLDKTPFYGECGGQVGDVGYLETQEGGKIEILNTFRVGKVFVHRGKGKVKIGDKVSAKIDVQNRQEIEKHHSLAHLLQAALQKTLGSDVHQAGSQVENNRTRYDFNYQSALTLEQIKKIEGYINLWIKEKLKRQTDIMSLDEAKKTGAMALFGEKYEDVVRVVSFKDNAGNTISKELCGGCHVKNSENLRLCKIVSESAIAAGVRRIEAVCSDSALEYLTLKADEIDKIAKKYKLPYTEVEIKIEKLLQDNKELNNKVEKMEEQNAKNQFATLMSRAQDIEINGVKGKCFITKTEDIPNNAIKTGVEYLANKLGESIIVLCSIMPNGVFVTAKVTDGFVKEKIFASNIVGEITKALGGNGGGRPQFAQGMGKHKENLDQILVDLKDNLVK